MVEPISTGAAIVAAGAWFANKLLGPSAEALGDQLKIYSNSRLSKIFAKAEQVSGFTTLNPLPPAFALDFVQKASLSEDDEQLTSLWANLVIDASANFSNRHMIFSSILSQMGGAEASYLSKLETRDPIKIFDLQRDGRRQFQLEVDAIYKHLPEDRDEAWSVINAIRELPVAFSGSLISISLCFRAEDGRIQWTGASRAGDDHLEVIDALARQRLVEIVTYRPSRGHDWDRIDAAELTPLGNRLLLTCNPKEKRE